MTQEAYFQIKKEIDGIINDCLHINNRIERLKIRYGIHLTARPTEYGLWGDNGEYSRMMGGTDFQIFFGGEELANVLDAPVKVDRALNDRRLQFHYRDCIFTQLANGNARFRGPIRRINRYTNAEPVNNPIDGISPDVV